jgi:hypothetical protein
MLQIPYPSEPTLETKELYGALAYGAGMLCSMVEKNMSRPMDIPERNLIAFQPFCVAW